MDNTTLCGRKDKDSDWLRITLFEVAIRKVKCYSNQALPLRGVAVIFASRIKKVAFVRMVLMEVDF